MKHRLKTPPAIEPVTLAEMRQHLGIGQADDATRDAIITGRIVSARTMAEHYTYLGFISQTWTAYADYFDSVLPLKAPLQSVTSLKYLDTDGVLQTLASDQYEIDIVTSLVVPAYGLSWPAARDQRNAIQVEYVCGYGDAAADVREPIKDAIRFTVSRWETYQTSLEGNMGYPPTLPNAALQLLQPYIDYREIM